MVGVFVTVMKLLTLYYLRNVAQVQEYVSLVMAYVVAVMLHFLLNKHVTFRIRDMRVINFMSVKYLLSLISAFCIYMGNIYLLYEMAGFPFYWAVFVALGVSYVVNFIIYEKLVFVEKRAGA